MTAAIAMMTPRATGSIAIDPAALSAAGSKPAASVDRLQLLDWKTGGGGEGAGLQLGGYALYALEVLGVDLARVDLLGLDANGIEKFG